MHYTVHFWEGHLYRDAVFPAAWTKAMPYVFALLNVWSNWKGDMMQTLY